MGRDKNIKFINCKPNIEICETERIDKLLIFLILGSEVSSNYFETSISKRIDERLIVFKILGSDISSNYFETSMSKLKLIAIQCFICINRLICIHTATEFGMCDSLTKRMKMKSTE